MIFAFKQCSIWFASSDCYWCPISSSDSRTSPTWLADNSTAEVLVIRLACKRKKNDDGLEGVTKSGLHKFKIRSNSFIQSLFFYPSSSLAPNPCAAQDGQEPCSHLCLINYNQTFSCACPHLMKLGPDRRTCYGENQPTD